jgi:hypothetical protein
VKLEPPIVRAAQRGEVSQVRLPLQAREPYYRQNTRLRSGQSSTLVKPYAPREGDRLSLRHKQGPAACHAIVTSVARSDRNEITYQDARAMGYRTTADAMAGWVRLHGTPPEEGCECCGGPGVCDGFCVTCGCDDQPSAAFHARHSHKPVWILTVELDRSHTARLLAASPSAQSDYVTSPAAALGGNADPGEAVEEKLQDLFTREGIQGFIAREASREADRERLSLEERLRMVRAEARAKGIDTYRLEQSLLQRVKAMEAKVHGRKAA